MFGLRWPELLLIFAVVLLVFGASRLPELGKAMGGALRGFKKSVSERDEDEGKVAAKAGGKLDEKRDA
jgi:sec-independent protein translocase protein TatA